MTMLNNRFNIQRWRVNLIYRPRPVLVGGKRFWTRLRIALPVKWDPYQDCGKNAEHTEYENQIALTADVVGAPVQKGNATV